METLILSGGEAIAVGAKLIKNGEVVAFPTETVYGLGGNALDGSCVAKIYAAKGRPSDNPLIVHVADIADISPLVKEFSAANLAVAKAFMPGPITLLFPKSDMIPDSVTAGLGTVGIRYPSHKVAQQFIKACGVPIAAPSANKSTRISPTTAKHVFEDMQGRIPLIIDGGDSDIGIESTVLDLTGDIPTILRPGAVTSDMLLKVIGAVRMFTGEVKVAPAPGMKYKHYAPIVDMALAKNIGTLVNEYDRHLSNGGNPLILARHEHMFAIGGRNAIDLGADDAQVTKHIYNAMREGEKICDYMLCIDLGDSELGKSVMNRVTKAAGGKKLDY